MATPRCLTASSRLGLAAAGVPAAMQSLAAPIGPDTDPTTLEALRVTLLENATKMAAMKRRAEATQREIDRVAAGTPAAAGPSRLGAIR